MHSQLVINIPLSIPQGIDPYMVHTRVPHCRACHKSALEFLLDLDSFSGIGLLAKQFKMLFSCCDCCDRIMTKQSFLNHKCLDQDFYLTDVREFDVIDLTEDD
jgi:hypothetical protein